MTSVVDVRRSGDRMRTPIGWLDSRHSFSFGHHYDPDNTHFGLLLVSNDDVVRAGTGFETHPHRDMEIVTWVLDGSLVHQDSEGNSGVLYPGLAQRMSAGTGILHSERNDAWRLGGSRHDGASHVGVSHDGASHDDVSHDDVSHVDDVHFVQMWVPPDTSSVDPGYEQLDIGSSLDDGDPVVVASGMPSHRDRRAISIRQRHAALYAARLPAAGSADLPAGLFVHLFIARGDVSLEGTGALATGDAARITDADGKRVVAGPSGAEILVWQMTARLGP